MLRDVDVPGARTRRDDGYSSGDNLGRDRDLNRELEQLEFRRIADAAHEIQRINGDYDAKLKRYRELVEGTARMPCESKAE